jgi:hypothetical protein
MEMSRFVRLYASTEKRRPFGFGDYGSFPESGKGDEAHGDGRAHPRLARRDLFENGELL